MKINTSIKFALHPSFLKNPDLPYSSAEPTMLSDIKKLFISLVESLKIAQEKKDYLKVKSSDAYTDLNVEFLMADEKEIGRGDSYKFCDNMPDSLSTMDIRTTLKETGINDTDMHDFILQLILQNRIGIHISTIGALGTIPVSLAKNSAQSMISIPVSAGKLEIKFDKFFEIVKLTYKSSIVGFISGKRLIIGEANLVVSILPNLETKIELLEGSLMPLKEIIKTYGNDRSVREYQDIFKNIYESLYEISALSRNPSLAYENKDETPFEPALPLDAPSSSNKFWEPVKQTFSTFISNIKNFGQEPLDKESLVINNLIKQTSTLKIQNQLKNGRPQSVGFETVHRELLNYKDDPFKLDTFTFYPSGIITHNVTSTIQEPRQATNGTFHMPTRMNGMDNPVQFRRSARPPQRPVVSDNTQPSSVEIKF